MIFHFGDTFKEQSAYSDQISQHPQSLVYGQVSQHFNLIAGKKISMLIVVFRPYGLAMFTSVAAKELTNSIISLTDIFGREAESLSEQVMFGKGHVGRIKLIEHWLLKRIIRKPGELLLVQACIDQSDRENGQLSVKQLSGQFSVSERTIERAFDVMVGISPKKYGRVIRLQHYLKLRKLNPALTLTSLSYDAGYYDQAHFIHEFSSLTGLTPKQYAANNNRLAVNLMWISKA